MSQEANTQLMQLIQKHINQLKSHPHVKQISLIKPFTYKLVYWPQDLDSLYSQMIYNLKLTIPQNYPQKSPFLIFLSKIYHLNVHPISGQVFMPILKDDWSPFLNLNAVISSLDQLLLQPDQNYAATTTLLQQYQQNVDQYVENVKFILMQNLNKNTPAKQSVTQQEIVEEVIQIKDLNYDTRQDFRQNKGKQIIINEGKEVDNITQQQISRDIPSKSAKKLQTQTKNQRQRSMQKRKQSNSKQKNLNNLQKGTQSISSIVKYDQTFKQSRQLMNENNLKKQNYDGLKQLMIKCKDLIKIYSQQLEQLQRQAEKTKNSKRLKSLYTQKCNKLQQMLVELFEMSQKINIKLMETVRNDFKRFQ